MIPNSLAFLNPDHHIDVDFRNRDNEHKRLLYRNFDDPFRDFVDHKCFYLFDYFYQFQHSTDYNHGAVRIRRRAFPLQVVDSLFRLCASLLSPSPRRPKTVTRAPPLRFPRKRARASPHRLRPPRPLRPRV